MKQILPKARDDVRFCEECESAYIAGVPDSCNCDHSMRGSGCEVCGEPCFGSRCSNHPLSHWQGQTVAEAMHGNLNTGERAA